MVADNSRKIKLLKIWEILSSETDEDHPMTTPILISKLQAFGIKVDRKTLYADIKVLNEFGFEVLCNRAASNEYFVSERNFNIPEIQILMDAVQAASFITPKKTTELVNKIAQLAGSQKAGVLKQNIVEFGTIKGTNESIYYSVNEISTAINSGKKLGYYYFHYNTGYERIYKLDKQNPLEKKWYVVNPVATVFSNDEYYLFCYDDQHMKITQYRVDRMENVTVLADDKTPNKKVENFDLAKYKRQLFGMFGGSPVQVSVEADISIVDYIFDKFGDKVVLTPVGGNAVLFTAEVINSPTFIAWCCAFGKQIKVISPPEVVNSIKNYLKEMENIYN